MPPFVAKEQEEEEEEEERTGLAEAINSLVESNPELDLSWAESVRQILESTQLSTPGPNNTYEEPVPSPRWDNRQWGGRPQHRDKVLAGLEGNQICCNAPIIHVTLRHSELKSAKDNIIFLVVFN